MSAGLRGRVIGSALAAILAASGITSVPVEQTKHGHRITKYRRPAPSLPAKPNGGHRRKKAIRAARLRKLRGERFGKSR
jgi:hypothetical protein